MNNEHYSRTQSGDERSMRHAKWLMVDHATMAVMTVVQEFTKKNENMGTWCV